MTKFPISKEGPDVVRVEPLARRDTVEWNDPALAVIFYCPGRDIEPGRKLFLGEKRDHFIPHGGIPSTLNVLNFSSVFRCRFRIFP